MHACDAGYVRSAPHASAYLRMRSGTRASSTANDSDAWGSRCADLPATAAGSGIRARKCSCHMEHCQMSRWGSARPRRSRLATRINISDVDGPRLSTCGRSVDHLQRLGEKRSRKLATARSDCILRKSKPFLTAMSLIFEMQHNSQAGSVYGVLILTRNDGGPRLHLCM